MVYIFAVLSVTSGLCMLKCFEEAKYSGSKLLGMAAVGSSFALGVNMGLLIFNL